MVGAFDADRDSPSLADVSAEPGVGIGCRELTGPTGAEQDAREGRRLGEQLVQHARDI
jgi:hypothetical protein